MKQMAQKRGIEVIDGVAEALPFNDFQGPMNEKTQITQHPLN